MDQPRETPLTARELARQQAQQRVGDTPEARVRRLIEIGSRYRYTGRLTSAEICAFRYELEVFSEARCSDDDVHRWLPRIYNDIHLLTEGKAGSHRLVTHYNFWVPREGQRPGIMPYRRKMAKGLIVPEEANTLHTSRTLKDRMAHRICEALAAVGTRLRRCQRKECGRLFVRRKRQIYCTPSCGSVMRIQRYRNKQRNRRIMA
jgi:hypothetical protein